MGLERLKKDAWSVEASPKIIANLELLSREWSLTTDVCCIFPECGSAFHEWKAVMTLKGNGVLLDRVVLMDAQIDPEWVQEWRFLADELALKLHIMDSYVALHEWIKPSPCIVLYMNGSMRFPKWVCGTHHPQEVKKAAKAFWSWCSQNVVNAPVNFVGFSKLAPCGCTSWSELGSL